MIRSVDRARAPSRRRRFSLVGAARRYGHRSGEGTYTETTPCSIAAMRAQHILAAMSTTTARNSWRRPRRVRVRAIRDRLREIYGRPINEPHGHPIAELVRTILSQNTNDRNRDVAYAAPARRLPTWVDVRDAAGRGGRSGDPAGRALEDEGAADPGGPAASYRARAASRRSTGSGRRSATRRSPS